MVILHVCLTILKVIGIVLLVLLGLAILILAAVLFSPFIYRAYGHIRKNKEKKDIDVHVKFHYLFGIIHGRADYPGSGLHISVKVFFITVYDNLKGRNDDKEIRHDKEKKYDKEKIQASKIDRSNEYEYKDADMLNAKSENTDNDGQRGQETVLKKKGKKWDFFRIREKIAEIVIKPFRLINRLIKAAVKKFKIAIKTIKGLKNRLSEIIDIICDDEVHDDIRYLWGLAKKILKKILPKKINARLAFGTADPQITGYILAFLGIMYPVYRENFRIVPDFSSDEYKIDTDFVVKGHFMVYYLLWQLFCGYRSDQYKRLKEKI